MTGNPDPVLDPGQWEALARYLSGESSPEEAERIRGWIAADPGRRQLVDRLGEILGQLQVDPAAVDVDRAWPKVQARMHQPGVISLDARRERSSRGWRTIALRVAAAVILVLGAGLWWRAREEPSGGVPVTSQTYRTTTGQVDSIRLADGSRVILAPGSELEVAAGFASPARFVTLRGEALFAVVHDATRPFSVRSGAALIEDLGTVFSVRSGVSEVLVVVQEGSVVLQDTGKVRPAVTLRAGDRGVLPLAGAARAQRSAVTEDDLAWTHGRLVFRDASLEQVREEFRRWYGVELRVDPAYAGRHLTAAFAGETADQVLRAIALALGARIERRGDTAFVGTK